MDKYVNLGMMFPGGNEVNVASLMSRHGTPSSYVGWLGNDPYGELLLGALEEEGVDTSHCYVKDDVTTYTEIYLDNGERRFGRTRRGASTRSKISADDLEFILGHDLLHTSYYSRMERFISRSNDELLVSFDFTEMADEKYLAEYLKYVDIAILPLEADRNIELVMKKYHNMGAELVLATLGSRGAYAYDGRLHFQPAVATDTVVDSLGAGDSFIARFLSEYLGETSIDDALALATESAFETCLHFGAFGHGIPIPEE